MCNLSWTLTLLEKDNSKIKPVNNTKKHERSLYADEDTLILSDVTTVKINNEEIDGKKHFFYNLGNYYRSIGPIK